MDRSLKEQLMQAMHLFKKAGMALHAGNDIRLGELFVLNGIDKNALCDNRSINVSDIHSDLHFTKPAVSQTLNALEKKGYIHREIDTSDRRKIAVTITPEGKIILEKTKNTTDQRIEEIISRFGEENTRELIRLLNLLAGISEVIKREDSQADTKGGHQLD